MKNTKALIAALQQIAARCSETDARRLARTALQQAGQSMPSDTAVGRNVVVERTRAGKTQAQSGVVVSVVAPGFWPHPAFKLMKGTPRKHESYVVATGANTHPRFIWATGPEVSWLPVSVIDNEPELPHPLREALIARGVPLAD